jgi:hypothetical protein
MDCYGSSLSCRPDARRWLFVEDNNKKPYPPRQLRLPNSPSTLPPPPKSSSRSSCYVTRRNVVIVHKSSIPSFSHLIVVASLGHVLRVNVPWLYVWSHALQPLPVEHSVGIVVTLSSSTPIKPVSGVVTVESGAAAVVGGGLPRTIAAVALQSQAVLDTRAAVMISPNV